MHTRCTFQPRQTEYSVGVEAGTYCCSSHSGRHADEVVSVRSQPIPVSADLIKDVSLAS